MNISDIELILYKAFKTSPTGAVPLVLSVAREYYLIQQEKNWNDAQAYCQAKHTDMAIINDNYDMIQLQNEIQRKQFSSKAWIGLYNDINSWRWSMGNEPLGNVTQWGAGKPNNQNGNRECGAINGLAWMDSVCSYLFTFICFDGKELVFDLSIMAFNKKKKKKRLPQHTTNHIISISNLIHNHYNY